MREVMSTTLHPATPVSRRRVTRRDKSERLLSSNIASKHVHAMTLIQHWVLAAHYDTTAST